MSGSRSSGRRRLWSSATAVVLGLVVTGCTAAPTPSDPTPLVPEDTADGPTATSDPTPTGAMDRTGDVPGLELGDLPEVEGDARSALDAYTLFEVEHWRSLLDGAVSPDLALMASADVVALVQNQVAGNKDGGFTVGGTNQVQVRDVEANGDVAIVEACVDERETTFTDDEGTRTGADFDFEPGVVVVELSKGSGAGWQVQEYDVTGGEPC